MEIDGNVGVVDGIVLDFKTDGVIGSLQIIPVIPEGIVLLVEGTDVRHRDGIGDKFHVGVFNAGGGLRVGRHRNIGGKPPLVAEHNAEVDGFARVHNAVVIVVPGDIRPVKKVAAF